MPLVPNLQTARPEHRDPALDGLRGVAILLVYVFHYGGGLKSHNPLLRACGYLTQAGWTGVELFFALSGFLITGLLWTNLGEAHALRGFFARRGLRILPLYYAALVAAGAVALLRGATIILLRPLLLYAGFVQNLPPLVQLSLHYPRPLPLNHLWTVALEVQFYLLWPSLLAFAAKKHRALAFCLGVFVLSGLFRATVFRPSALSAAVMTRWAPFLLTRAGGLALGGALAVALLSRRGVNELSRRFWTVAAVLGIAVFLLAGLPTRSLLLDSSAQFTWGLPGVEVAAVALLALARQPGPWRTFLALRPLRLLGRISYGFYVLHILLEPLFDHIGRVLTHTGAGSRYQLTRLLVAFPLTVLAAWVSFRLLERPFLRWKRFFPRNPDPIA